MKFDHLGLVVKDLTKGRQGLTESLGIRQWTDEVSDPVNGVRVQFGRDAFGVTYELIEPLSDHSPVADVLRTRRNVLNHIAYLVDDLAAAAEQFLSAGCGPTSEPRPAVAYKGRLIQFFVSPQNFVIELIEAPDHEHLYHSLV